MTKAPRKNPTALQKKELQQEADSKCAWCGNDNPESWEFHHIDGRPENTVNDNLILLCGACHNIAEAHNGKITIDDLYQKKRELAEKRKTSSVEQRKIINDSIVAKGNMGCSFTQNIYHTGKMTTRVSPAVDSIGNNAEARNMINLLVRKLGDYRLKGHPDRNAKGVFSAINKDLAKHFGATSVPNISISRMSEVIFYLEQKIGNTTQGRMNKGRKDPRK